MNKAKIVLTAVAVFAVIGGALAFKAKMFNFSPAAQTTTRVTSFTAGGVYSATRPINNPFCTTTLPTTLYVTVEGPLSIFSTISTTQGLSPAITTGTLVGGSATTTFTILNSCPTTETWVTTAQ